MGMSRTDSDTAGGNKSRGAVDVDVDTLSVGVDVHALGANGAGDLAATIGATSFINGNMQRYLCVGARVCMPTITQTSETRLTGAVRLAGVVAPKSWCAS